MSEWQSKRTMSGREFKRIIKELGMTQVGAGRYIGLSGRTARRIVLGQSEIPVAAALLLRSLVAHNEKPLVPNWQRGDN
jgi:hypothetical protein